MTIVLDTDALLALADVNDAHHSHARELAKKMADRNISLLLSPTTITEFALLCAKRLGLDVAKKLVKIMLEDYQVFDVDSELFSKAINIYQKQTSLAESLFDCVVMAIAQKSRAQAIFSFDKGYVKNGFVLVDDYLGGEIAAR